MNEAVSILSVRVVSKAHEGYLRAGVRLGAGVNEITVSPAQLAAMEADPRLVVTVLAAPENDAAADDAPPQGGVDSGLDGSGVVAQESPPPIPSHYAPVPAPVPAEEEKAKGRNNRKAKAEG